MLHHCDLHPSRSRNQMLSAEFFLNTEILSSELIHISVFILILISDTELKHQSAESHLSR